MSNYQVSASGVNQVDALLEGYKWQTQQGEAAVISYSFPTGTASWSADYGQGEPLTWSSFSDADRQAVREVLSLWSEVANITFVESDEATGSIGDLRFAYTSQITGNTAGWAYTVGTGSYYDPSVIEPSPEAGDVWINPNQNLNEGGGSAGFSTLLHEVGHAIGIKHPFDGSPNLSLSQDSNQYTVMSYTGFSGAGYRYTDTGGNSYSYQEIEPESPMLLDIQAVQYLYGVNMETRAGDDVYSFATDGFVKTIWDAGGVDVFDFSNQLVGVNVNLGDGQFSSVGQAKVGVTGYDANGDFNYSFTPSVDNLSIASGALIENAVGSAFDDVLVGNHADNVLTGGTGGDFLDGAEGVDTAVYGLNFDQYNVAWVNNVLEVDALTGSDGRDQLANIEWLQFADVRAVTGLSGQVFLGQQQLVNVDLTVSGGQMGPQTVSADGQGMYQLEKLVLPEEQLSQLDIEATTPVDTGSLAAEHIGAQDALRLLLSLQGQQPLNDLQQSLADVNQDAVTDLVDVQAILDIAVGHQPSPDVLFVTEQALGLALGGSDKNPGANDLYGLALGDLNLSLAQEYLDPLLPV